MFQVVFLGLYLNAKDQKIRVMTFHLKEEGRGTRNGYEASKGSKGISGL